MKYSEFLVGKQFDDPVSGHDVPIEYISPNHGTLRLFPFQEVIVRWALKRGRAAVFADTGLGKTAMQAVWAHHVTLQTWRPVLIVAPLSVAHQTVTEARKFGVEIEYLRHPTDALPPIVITNYEMLEHFDLTRFGGVVLDESSILKAKDGKTRTAIIEACCQVPYRLSCTATPSPNDHMELGNQAEFLGVMSTMEMLAMFFTHDGKSTQNWRLKGHAVARFWEWMSTWAVVVRNPSDLGFDSAGYDLPPLRIHEHFVDSAEDLPEVAGTLSEQRQVKRATVEDRVAACAELVNNSFEPWLVWCHLNDESSLLEKSIPDSVAVEGSDTIKHKEATMDSFSDGALRVLVSKSSICGFGMNWQHCHNIAFVGIDHSFEQFYQAIRRCWRFGQTQPVDVHLFIARPEHPVLESLQRKEAQHQEMSRRMVDHMRDLMHRQITGTKIERAEYVTEKTEGANWELYLGDCVDVVGNLPSDSLDYSVFSPPFASLYVYSNSDRDMGNATDHDEFFQHFGYLVGDLLRTLKAGRLVSVHCMNLPTSKVRDGVIGIRDFRGEIIRLFEDAGFIFHSEVCIWKDPVTAMQRTKALGLLHKQLKKDSAMSRQGIADYLVTFRKPGENPEPVSHTDESFPVDRWQRYASPIWTDIRQTNTLQFREARDEEDERHICPLQLEVIERCIELWTNPGDLVLSPFAGIGSEGYVTLQKGRRFIGVELKKSYWEVAKKNLAKARPYIADFMIEDGARSAA